jgi:8-oxo-dGTP pyrophosphatase MutT (NUDIX family)
MLTTYVPFDEIEEGHLTRFRSFLARYPSPFDRTIVEGHLTGSAFILDASFQNVLLLHHRKVQRWLQPGGHAEPGEIDPESVALREAQEETGIENLVWHPAAPRPFDLDIHEFPARGSDPAHWHLDVRYLLVAPDDAVLKLAVEESTDLRWFGWDELVRLNLDTGTERALKKARALAGTGTNDASRP